MPFNMEINQAFIAAILTVIGYSLNDTVVVFDRIREYVGEHTKWQFNDTVNAALNSTLSRTLNTSLTTLIVLLAIFIFGGESIRGVYVCPNSWCDRRDLLLCVYCNASDVRYTKRKGNYLRDQIISINHSTDGFWCVLS